MKITEVTKKDGSTVYRTSVYLGTDRLTGKKVTTKLTARTKRELNDKIIQEKAEFRNNGYTRHKAVTVKTYEELAWLWWDSYKDTVKVSTQDNVMRLLKNHVLPLFGKYKLERLTVPLVQSIVNDLANRTNRGEPGAFLHYNQIHALNKRILQYGVTMQVLASNPARDVILPRNTKKGSRSKVKHLEAEEVKTWLDYLDNLDTSKFKWLYDVTLYKFLLATGCRINEALALSWSDIDLENGVVSITKSLNNRVEIDTPKTKSSIRDIDIDTETVTMLKNYQLRQVQEAWKLGRTETVVFSDFVHPYAIHGLLRDHLKVHLKRAGLPSLGFHAFRHTHASLLLNSGIPYKELQHRLGHTNISMTMDTYSHLSKENAKKAVSFYEKALGSL